MQVYAFASVIAYLRCLNKKRFKNKQCFDIAYDISSRWL